MSSSRRSVLAVALFVCGCGSAAAEDQATAAAVDQATKVFIDPHTNNPLDKRLLYARKADPASRREQALSEEARAKLKKTDPNAKIRAVGIGDEVAVRVLNEDCRFEKIKFEEKERHTRFYDDVHAIIGKLKGATDLASCADPVLEATYILQHTRATLTITAVSKAGEKDDAVLTVITGPKEHLYLGIDLPGTRKTLKYDSGTKTLQPQGDNPQVYISINYSVGDVAGDPKDFPAISLDRVSVKALFLASKRPLDSVGIGIGYQLPRLDFPDLSADLSAISVFGGKFWTKQDAIASNGTPQANAATGHDWRIGVTYDVASGMKWLKSM